MKYLKQLGASLVLPQEYQQKIALSTDDIHSQHQNQQIQLINDFAKAKQKFNNDWENAANEADYKIENIKNQVTQEYTSSQLNSVRNYWNEQEKDINRALESDKFLDDYLKPTGDAMDSDNFIQSYLGVKGPCIHDVLECEEKDLTDSVIQSDKFIQSYLDDDKTSQTAVNEFDERSKIINEAAESDILLEKYLLDI